MGAILSDVTGCPLKQNETDLIDILDNDVNHVLKSILYILQPTWDEPNPMFFLNSELVAVYPRSKIPKRSGQNSAPGNHMTSGWDAMKCLAVMLPGDPRGVEDWGNLGVPLAG
jgi:hypothetical protein